MATFVLWIGAVVAVAGGPGPWWDAKVEASLRRSPEKKPIWEAMLAETPPERRPGMAYLVTDLPVRDLETLPPASLASNVALAYQVRGEVAWGKNLPEEIFLDDVLPHVSTSEPRDSMRREFHDRYLPLVRDCKTPGEAGLRVNKTLFKDYKVGYNTRRLRTDQCSKESIAQGMATCTGLSIMLVEACRAVGVPARVAGISSWPGRGGNHTWVEVWDGGWHYVGAAEPDEKGLDHAWFGGDAAKAIKGSPRNAIWAVTYRNTGELFPVVWSRDARINGENVTDRYTGGVAPAKTPPKLMVEVKQGGERVEAEVVALEESTGSTFLSDKSLGRQTDVNLHLCRPATSGEQFLVVARHDGHVASAFVTVNAEDTVLRLDLDHPSPEFLAKLTALLVDRFGTDPDKKAVAGRLLAELPPTAETRSEAWLAYRSSPRHDPLKREFVAKTVSTKDRASPYLWRRVGEKPKEGWSLVIAMHGGGGAPKSVNDSQWKGMFERYYHDHPEAGGYVYLALRAPNDMWNGFYDDAICPLVERLIRQFVLFGDVNPDRVYALGASHGGYGAFVIGPKMPDRFAAVHASASAPTDGETMGENLRNTMFTFMVGENDTAYGRASRCLSFAKQVDDWRGEHGGYPGTFEWRPDVGHSVPDREKVGEMIRSGPRKPWPKKLVWAQSDNVLTHHFWVEAMKPADRGRVEASVVGNTIKVNAEGQGSLALWLDQPLLDLAKPVVVEVGGKTTNFTPKPSLETYCLGLEERGDPRLAATVRIEVDLAPCAKISD